MPPEDFLMLIIKSFLLVSQWEAFIVSHLCDVFITELVDVDSYRHDINMNG